MVKSAPLGRLLTIMVIAAAVLHQGPSAAQEGPADFDPARLTGQGLEADSAIEIAPGIFQATGFGNSFRITTSAGDVIVDTSLATTAPKHKELLDKVSDGAIRYIVVTHAHVDHIGGIDLWREETTQVIAHKASVEFLNYQHRLRGFLSRRNAAQFAGRTLPVGEHRPVENYGATIPATRLTGDEFAFTLGQRDFVVLHTPGETYDAVSVWLPKEKAVFVGYLYYRSSPNIYTLRGTKPRWALDYVESLNKILALRPALLIPSHGEPIEGPAAIRDALTRYRDAILYVHDATVAGMNAGKDVATLAQEIALPQAFGQTEAYGRVSWTVRGIHDGYVGWFDGNPSSMYPVSTAQANADIVALAGGPDAVARRAEQLLAQTRTLRALRLADIALAVQPAHEGALAVRLKALTALRRDANNFNEAGWLDFGIADAKRRLGR